MNNCKECGKPLLLSNELTMCTECMSNQNTQPTTITVGGIYEEESLLDKMMIKRITECSSCNGTGYNRVDVGGKCWDCLGQGYIEVEEEISPREVLLERAEWLEKVSGSTRVCGDTKEFLDLATVIKQYIEQQEYLVVYEDEWNNKVSLRTTKIGDAILQLSKENDFVYEDVNIEKLNSEEPWSAGTLGPVFYDIDVKKNNEDDEYGRIMIFAL